MSAVWHLDDLTVQFPGITAVRDASLSIHPGERVGLVGASGSGKTTLVRAGLGLIRPSGGRVHLFGEDTATWTPGRWLAARRDAQLLFQDPRSMLHPALTLELLLLDTAAVHQPEADGASLVHRVLAAVGLGDRARALPHELSGGERRRAGVARVLLTKPRLLVVDEPTVGLDASLKAELLQLLLDQTDLRCAVVLISHDLALVSWATERLLVMDQGTVVENLPVAHLDAAEHPTTRALIEAAGLLEAG